MTDHETFKIPSWNMPKLEKKIAQMNKRAAKIGVPPVTIRVVDTTDEIAPEYRERAAIIGKRDWFPTIKVYEIAIEGEGPKIAGWTFVGTLDHNTLPGSVIVNTVPGETVPSEFYNHDAICNHCGKVRRRNETFVLHHEEDDKHTQVGRQCLRDFLGHDPKAVASFLTSLRKLEEELGDPDGEWYGGGGKWEYSYDHDAVLAATAAVIEKEGWVPRSAAFDRAATASLVLDVFLPPPTSGKERARHIEWKESLDLENEKFTKEAKEAREWLKSQNNDNEYMHNLHTIDKAEKVPTKMFGYWCSVVAAYQRAMERLRIQKAEKKISEYFGNVGDRVEHSVKVVSIRYTDGYFGTVGVVKMLDDDGRTFVWFANTKVGMEPDHQYRIKGTIKKHEEYQDWKQTVVNRVKVQEEIS